MPQLSLGACINKATRVQTPLQSLVKSSSWLINMDKATGAAPGVNSPFTNPVIDLKGNANVTLTNFGATTSSGYVVDTNAGKTFTMLKFDGTDDYGLAANHPNLDITGTGDFAIAAVFKTVAFNVGMILSKALNDSPTNAQYALFTINDTLYLRLGGQTYPFGSVISTNTLYKCIVYRNSGVLKCKLNGVQIFSASNNVDVVSQPSFLVGAESNGLGGATTFTNIFLGHLSIINGAITPFTEADLIADWDRFCADKYGL